MSLIHHGSKPFDIKKFMPVENQEYRNKPTGGLWASPVGASFGWKEWCIQESFHVSKLDTWFKFDIEGWVYKIDSIEDMKDMFTTVNGVVLTSPDFEELVDNGVDAIWLTLKGERETRLSVTRQNLYGWDCECVLVLNPECIIINGKHIVWDMPKKKDMSNGYTYRRGDVLDRAGSGRQRPNPNDDLWYALEYNPSQSFNHDEVVSILAEVPGENDELSWWWVLELTRERYILVSGWCDFTGWDCQSGIEEYPIVGNKYDAPLYAPASEEYTGRTIRSNLTKQLSGTQPKYTYMENRK